MGGHEQAKASKGNQVDVKYGARDREVTCGRSQGKQFWGECHGLELGPRHGASVRQRSRQKIGLAKTLVQESERESQDSYRACQSHQTWPIAWRSYSPFTLAMQKRKVASYLKMITEARLVARSSTFVLALPHDSPTFRREDEERLKRLRPHDPSDLDSDIPTIGLMAVARLYGSMARRWW
ncbi:hypothetical protein F3Y22_tig00001478pilonHSYRG00523 [Hibiscus syriacus]|uniref:Uncharacterized protein n=1 Tax=Hibiscus syriacus TaxID=106335 RepID=A0A6A3CXW8_HIBSY|nr:hypothetical protein F3Y22_tig00001478pilonHSYRG00523 [Hibiscus syriacus]